MRCVCPASGSTRGAVSFASCCSVAALEARATFSSSAVVFALRRSLPTSLGFVGLGFCSRTCAMFGPSPPSLLKLDVSSPGRMRCMLCYFLHFLSASNFHPFDFRKLLHPLKFAEQFQTPQKLLTGSCFSITMTLLSTHPRYQSPFYVLFLFLSIIVLFRP